MMPRMEMKLKMKMGDHSVAWVFLFNTCICYFKNYMTLINGGWIRCTIWRSFWGFNICIKHSSEYSIPCILSHVIFRIRPVPPPSTCLLTHRDSQLHRLLDAIPWRPKMALLFYLGCWYRSIWFLQIPTLICAIMLPLRIGCLFTHVNYHGSKKYNKKLHLCVIIHIATTIK